MPLINFKINFELNWTKNYAMYGSDAYAAVYNNNGETTFKITNTNLYVSIVTLSTKGNANLTKQLNEGFKRPAYWNEYKTNIEPQNLDNNNLTRFYLDASFQGVKILFVLAFDNTDNGNKKVGNKSYRKCFLPRVNITN